MEEFQSIGVQMKGKGNLPLYPVTPTKQLSLEKMFSLLPIIFSSLIAQQEKGFAAFQHSTSHVL